MNSFDVWNQFLFIRPMSDAWSDIDQFVLLYSRDIKSMNLFALQEGKSQDERYQGKSRTRRGRQNWIDARDVIR